MTDSSVGHAPYHPTGYKMIRSADIKEFKCFEHANLKDCRTINVIVGRNASGKTALLEAMFLALGASPEVVLRLKKWRGYDSAPRGTSEEIDKSIWRDLFNGFDLSKVVNINLEGTDTHARQLKIRYREQGDLLTSPEFGNATVVYNSPVIFEYKRPKSPEKKVTVQFVDGQYHWRGVDTVLSQAAFFASGYPFPQHENIDRFSKISKARHAEELVEAISNEFGFVKGVEILSNSGEPMLHVDTPWYEEKIPLSAISSGVSKLVYLLIAIIAMPKSVLFIDEIENGFYYDRFPSLWGTLHRLCKAHDVQIFASTHSWECLEAMKNALADHPNDVSFIRSTMEAGKATVEQYHGSTFFPAIDVGEVR